MKATCEYLELRVSTSSPRKLRANYIPSRSLGAQQCRREGCGRTIFNLEASGLNNFVVKATGELYSKPRGSTNSPQKLQTYYIPPQKFQAQQLRRDDCGGMIFHLEASRLNKFAVNAAGELHPTSKHQASTTSPRRPQANYIPCRSLRAQRIRREGSGRIIFHLEASGLNNCAVRAAGELHSISKPQGSTDSP